MGAFDYQKVKDPRYFQEGRMEAHSDHPYYASAEKDTGKAATANIQLTVDESANTVEDKDIITITHRPLYLKAGNTKLVYKADKT